MIALAFAVYLDMIEAARPLRKVSLQGRARNITVVVADEFLKHAAVAFPSAVTEHSTIASGGAPAPGPAPGPQFAQAMTPPPPPPPPPPTPPPPMPPKIPVATPEDCKIFEKAFILNPKVKCQHIVMSSNWDACMCTIFLPGSIAPMPDNLYNPYAVEVPPDPDIPIAPPMPSVPPPSNPLQPYNPPLGEPECPFIKKCGRLPGDDSFAECVGYDSWGFDEVRMGKYSPASRFFNSVNCFYIMKPYNRFHVPKKLEAFWYLAKKRGDVKDLYDSEELTLACEDQSFTNPWVDFCDDMVWRLKTSCQAQWKDLWTGTCKKAPAPPGFRVESYLGEFCPLDCGFIKYKLEWPYPVPPGPPAPAPAAAASPIPAFLQIAK